MEASKAVCTVSKAALSTADTLIVLYLRSCDTAKVLRGGPYSADWTGAVCPLCLAY